MIFYEQDEKQIIFFLDEPVVEAIAEWNHRNYSHLELEDDGWQGFIPRFQLTLQHKLDHLRG